MLEQTKAGDLGDGRVEQHVRLGSLDDVAHADHVLHVIDDPLEPLEVCIRDALRGAREDLLLDDRADPVIPVDLVVPDPKDRGAPPVLEADQSLVSQMAKGFPHGRPTHAESLGHVGFREVGAGLELAGQQRGAQFVKDSGLDRFEPCGDGTNRRECLLHATCLSLHDVSRMDVPIIVDKRGSLYTIATTPSAGNTEEGTHVTDRITDLKLSRRRLLQVGATTAGAAFIAACSPSTASPSGAPASPGASAPGLSFSGRKISVITHSGHDLYLPTTVIPAFEKATGATVEYIPIPPGDLNTRWTTMAAAQDGSIDVLYGSAAQAATFAGTGIYEDLTESAKDIIDGMIPATRQASTWDSKVWFLAMDSVEWIFLYNTEMYEQAGLDPNTGPATFDEYIEMSKKLTVGDRYGTHMPINWFTYTLLYNSTGAEVLSEDVRTLNADTAESKLVMAKMKELVDSKAINPASYSPDVTFDAGEGFRTETIAHYIGATTHYPRSQNPDLATTIGKVKMTLVPGLKNRSGSSTGNEGFGVNAFSKNKDVALEFARFLHNDDMQKYVALEWGRGPGQQRYVDDPALLAPDLAEKYPHITVLLEQVKHPARRYQAPFYFDLDKVFTENLLKLVTGQQSVDETASTCQKLGQEIVDKFWASA